MGHSVATEDNKSRTVTTKAAMIFALIIVGLLIATANFVQIMGHSDDHGAGHGDAHATEASHGGDAHGTHEADKAHAPSHGATEPQPAAPATTTPQEHAESGTATPSNEAAHH